MRNNKKKITKDIILMRILCGLMIFGIIGLTVLCPIPATAVKTIAKEMDSTNNEFTIDQVVTSRDDFVQIKENLYYDQATCITYLRQKTYGFNCTYVPYPSPNGLPFKYDPGRKVLYMITFE